MMVRACGIIWGLIAAFLASADAAYASSTVFGIDRAMWDAAWRWINFAILVYLILRYLKGPVVKFIQDRRLAVAGVFERLQEKEEALGRRRQEQEALLAGLDDKIESIKAYYHEIGREEKEKILADAERLRRQILEDAKATAVREFEEAKKRLREEVVEMAVSLAEARIRKKITKKDQRQLLDGYVAQLEALGARGDVAEG